MKILGKKFLKEIIQKNIYKHRRVIFMEKIIESYIGYTKELGEPVQYHVTELGDVYKVHTISYGSQYLRSMDLLAVEELKSFYKEMCKEKRSIITLIIKRIIELEKDKK